MSQTQTQIQINSQTLNQIPKSIQVLKIPRVYNIIRSIIESSTKAEYLHNQPIKVSENVVKFVKYRNVRRIWTVVVEKFSSEEGEGYRVEVLEAPVTLTVYKVKVQQNERGIPIACENVVELEVDGHRFANVYELEATYITSNAPYSKPICLADLVQRLLHLLRFVNTVG